MDSEGGKPTDTSSGRMSGASPTDVSVEVGTEVFGSGDFGAVVAAQNKAREADERARAEGKKGGAMDDLAHMGELRPADLFAALPPLTQEHLKKLTTKQRDFVLLVTHGVSDDVAYRRSYAVKPTTKDVSVAANASKLRKSKTIQEALEKVEAGAISADVMQSNADSLTKQWVLERLMEEANPEKKKNTGSVRVRALELIGKAMGMFEDVQVVKDERPKTKDEARQRFMELMRLAADDREGGADAQPLQVTNGGVEVGVKRVTGAGDTDGDADPTHGAAEAAAETPAEQIPAELADMLRAAARS